MTTPLQNARKLQGLVYLEAPTELEGDARAAIQAALDDADGISKTIIDGRGLRYSISAPIKFTKANTELVNFVLMPTVGFNGGTVVYTDMGTGAGGESAGQKANRGNALIRMVRDDTAYAGADFVGCAIRNVRLECGGLAPGICVANVVFAEIDRFTIKDQKGYALAMLVKNTDSRVSNGSIRGTAFGSPSQLDPVTYPYTSAGFVQTCADIVVSKVASAYCAHPIWADGLANTQWESLHTFNGNGVAASLPNIYIGPDASGIQCINLYLDNGYIALHSFNHTFTGGRFAKTDASANLVYAKLVAQGASQAIRGLIIDGVSMGDVGGLTISKDETLGSFTEVSNSKITAMTRRNTSGATRSGYANDKTLVKTIAFGDWVSEGSGIYRYDWNIETDLAFPGAYTTVEPRLRDRRTGTAEVSAAWWWRFTPNSGTGTKIIKFYSTVAHSAEAYARVNEGQAIIS